MTPIAAKAAAECNVARTASAHGFRFFSQTARVASEEKNFEEAERTAAEEVEVRPANTHAYTLAHRRGWDC
jgi:hypothetical protein